MVFALRIFRTTKCLQTLKRIAPRGIAMTSNNLSKVMEKLEKNPYYEKYAQRIAELQRTSPDEFLQRVENVDQSGNAKRSTLQPDTRQYSSVLNPKAPKIDSTPSGEKKLDEIFKVELVQEKDASEIQDIWEQYHKNKDVISATIPHDQYKCHLENMKKYNTFLFPLPRAQGYEFIVCQCHGHSVHFTPLLAYQVHKENSPECLTMVHYTDLQHKGIVLMRGDYDKNVLNAQEAQCLANQFQMYYSGKDATKFGLLQTFTEKPDSFKHMDLVAQLENISLV